MRRDAAKIHLEIVPMTQVGGSIVNLKSIGGGLQDPSFKAPKGKNGLVSFHFPKCANLLEYDFQRVLNRWEGETREDSRGCLAVGGMSSEERTVRCISSKETVTPILFRTVRHLSSTYAVLLNRYNELCLAGGAGGKKKTEGAAERQAMAQQGGEE